MTERVGALRNNGVVINVILWTDETANQLLKDGIIDFEEVTHLDPRPGIGWLWDEVNGYRPPRPYPSWTWNGVAWQPPVAMPTEGGPFQWNEDAKSWSEIPTPET